MSSVYKIISLEFISDDILTTAGGFGMLCNGLSRLFWSSMLDKFSFKKVYFSMMAI